LQIFTKLQGHVYESDGKHPWSATLNQTNIGSNNNKFYIVQLIELDNSKQYYVFTRWGRVGGVHGKSWGSGAKTFDCTSLDHAKETFCEKFYDKTLNAWEDRDKFETKKGKYTLIEIDYGNEDEEEEDSKGKEEKQEKEEKRLPKSSLDPKVEDLVTLIFDIKMMEDVMKEMEFDIKKMPLGKLTKKQIKEGFEVLQELKKEIKNGKKVSKLTDLSSRFYTLVPHNFGMKRPPIIDNEELLKEKLQMVEALSEIEIATTIMKGTRNKVEEEYKKLKTEIKPLDPTNEDHKLIQQYVSDMQKDNAYVPFDILEIFEIQREGEQEIYKPVANNIGNRVLLWHGSRLTNYAGILSQGLRIAPPEAPCSGYRFGKGIYFADVAGLSAHYCRVSKSNPVGCLLLADVALGEMYEAPKDEFMSTAKPKYHSTFALGTKHPDPKRGIVKDGMKIPIGPLVPTGRKNVSCIENQYIIYDVSQANLKYLIKCQWRFP